MSRAKKTLDTMVGLLAALNENHATLARAGALLKEKDDIIAHLKAELLELRADAGVKDAWIDEGGQ